MRTDAALSRMRVIRHSLAGEPEHGSFGHGALVAPSVENRSAGGRGGDLGTGDAAGGASRRHRSAEGAAQCVDPAIECSRGAEPGAVGPGQGAERPGTETDGSGRRDPARPGADGSAAGPETGPG